MHNLFQSIIKRNNSDNHVKLSINSDDDIIQSFNKSSCNKKHVLEKNKILTKILIQGLSVKEYHNLTSDMFKQVHMIKDFILNQETPYQPFTEDEKIKLKFTKPGFDKLLLFDLDETLIHVKRSEIEEQDYDAEDDDFQPEIEIPIFDPYSQTTITASFSVRPFVKECLELANKYFEVGIFTAGKQWFANPILDHLDPDGKLF